MTDRYAVIGNPVAHSKSPQIHAAFARATGQDMSYERLLAPLGRLRRRRSTRFARDGRQRAQRHGAVQARGVRAGARVHRARAARPGAVNTLKRAGDDWYGDNTDGAGLVRDLTTTSASTLAGRDILVLGAGGAARGILQPLLARTPRSLITIANRTLAKADALAREFSAHGPIRAVAPRTRRVASEAHHVADVVINATSSAWPTGRSTRVAVAGVDLRARRRSPTTWSTRCDEPTPFLRLGAGAAGPRARPTASGMLIEQAAESFFLWRGVRPDTAPVFPLLRTRAA